MNLQGLHLHQRSFQLRHTAISLNTRNDRLQCSFLRQQRGSDFQQKTFAAGPGRSKLTTTAVRSSHGSNDVPKSVFSFNILDILGFLIRIPTLLLGFINKERKVIDEIEDRLEDAAETVGDIAEVVEKVAGVVEKVAESIAEDAKETRELMDKVEATAGSMRSDINTAIDNLQEAAQSKVSSGEAPASEVKDAVDAATEASSKASQKAQEVKEAVIELEGKGKSQEVKEAVIELEGKGKSQTKFQAVTFKRPIFWSVLLASLVIVVTNWWLPQLPYAVKLLSELFTHILI